MSAVEKERSAAELAERDGTIQRAGARAPRGRVRTDAERAQWLRQVAEAAEKAAQRLRELDDAGNGQLLNDLEELRQRLLAELQASDDAG